MFSRFFLELCLSSFFPSNVLFLGTTSSALQRPQQTFLSFWMKSYCKVSRQEAQAISASA